MKYTKKELQFQVEDLKHALIDSQTETQMYEARAKDLEEIIERLEKEAQPRPNEVRKKSVIFFRNSFPESETATSIWAIVVAQHSGLVIGRIMPSKGGVPSFYLNPGAGCLTYQALADIAEYVCVQELALAS